MTRKISIHTGTGLLVFALGVTVMAGWLLGNPALAQMRPGFVAMVFNTALCFSLLGIAFVLPMFSLRRVQFIQQLIGALVFALSTGVLIEGLLDINLMLDREESHAWLVDGNPRPGRMAPNTAGGFMIAGVVLILLPMVRSKAGAMMIYTATFAVMVLGLTGLVGYSLQLELLYSWFNAARMAVHTAVGMILVGVSLWSCCISTEWYRTRSLFRVDDLITMTAACVLIMVVTTAGVTAFAMQQSALERALGENLTVKLINRHDIFNAEIEQTFLRAKSDALRPLLKRALQAHRLNESTVRSDLELVTRSILASSTVRVLIRDSQGQELLRAGVLPDTTSDTGFRLDATSILLWDRQFLLESTLPISDAKGLLGELTVVQPLPLTSQQFLNETTTKIEVCRLLSEQLQCYPTLPRQAMYQAPLVNRRGQKTPMVMAVEDQSGIFKGVDYRGDKVITAYSALAPNGLGLVVYEYTTELLAPLRKQLELIAPLIVLLIIAGTLLLRWQVKPLATQLLRSEREANNKELRLRTIVGSMNEGVITFDANGRIESSNEAAAKMFGYSVDEMMRQEVSTLVPWDLRQAQESGAIVYEADGKALSLTNNAAELTGTHKNGGIFPIELSVNSIYFDEKPLFVGIVRDITERKQAELLLHEEKERLRVTLRSIGDAVITTDISGNIVYLNPVAEKMTGWTTEEATGLPIPTVFNIVHEKTGELALNPVSMVLRDQAPAGLAENTVLVNRDGTHFPIEDSAAPIHDINGHIIGVVVVFHDVSAARLMATKMTHQAMHDSLTGLINRREFERRLELSIQSGRMEQKTHTLLYLDLDQFKIVNDTCGHMAGDELLRQLTSIMQGRLRQHDTLARLGGDEFGVLLESCAAEHAVGVAENLRQVVKDFQFMWEGKAFPIGVSIGLVAFSNGGLSVADVMRMADAACYVSKDKGRNRIHVYTPEDAEITHRAGEMGWIGRLQHALDHDEFVLYAQKILPLSPRNHGQHFEILLRMRDGDNLIPPMAFIPAAERYGLMPAIDRWVIQSALQNKEVRSISAIGGTCAINLSGASISDDNFLDFVLKQFEACQIDPATICFEITETAAITNLVHATGLINRLRSIGCRFSLDDFGSGMSSFAYLKHLPVDYLKIDGGFIKDILDDPIDCAMVESINHIGHVTGLETIAEFVENDAILQKLREIGVDFAQGYGVGKPMPLAT